MLWRSDRVDVMKKWSSRCYEEVIELSKYKLYLFFLWMAQLKTCLEVGLSLSFKFSTILLLMMDQTFWTLNVNPNLSYGLWFVITLPQYYIVNCTYIFTWYNPSIRHFGHEVHEPKFVFWFVVCTIHYHNIASWIVTTFSRVINRSRHCVLISNDESDILDT